MSSSEPVGWLVFISCHVLPCTVLKLVVLALRLKSSGLGKLVLRRQVVNGHAMMTSIECLIPAIFYKLNLREKLMTELHYAVAVIDFCF